MKPIQFFALALGGSFLLAGCGPSEPAPTAAKPVAESSPAPVVPPPPPAPVAPSISIPAPAPAAPIVSATPEPAPAVQVAAPPAIQPNATALGQLQSLGSDQLSQGLKEALGRGLQSAVAQLGQNGGFLTNLNVKIPLPAQFQQLEKILARVGQGGLLDEFSATMNHAAEQAVPVAAPVFASALQQMTIEDAKAILSGTTNAATKYFQEKIGGQLTEKFKPIVQQATEKTGVTAAYKSVMDKAKFASPFTKFEALDLDGYVTQGALQGLFKMVGEEEARIRQNPAARTTDLLKSVFGRFRS